MSWQSQQSLHTLLIRSEEAHSQKKGFRFFCFPDNSRVWVTTCQATSTPQKPRIPTANRNTEASCRDSQQEHILQVTTISNLWQTFSSIQLNGNFDFKSFFFIIFNLKAAWARRGKTQWSLTECEQRRLLKPQAFMCFATPLLISSYADRKTSFYFHLWNLFLFIYIYSHSSFKRRHIAKISTDMFT